MIPFIVGQASIQTDVTITDAGDDGDGRGGGRDRWRKKGDPGREHQG